MATTMRAASREASATIADLERQREQADARREHAHSTLIETGKRLARARLLTDGHLMANYEGPPPRPEEVWSAHRDRPTLEREYVEQKLAAHEADAEGQAALQALREAKLRELEPQKLAAVRALAEALRRARPHVDRLAAIEAQQADIVG